MGNGQLKLVFSIIIELKINSKQKEETSYSLVHIGCQTQDHMEESTLEEQEVDPGELLTKTKAEFDSNWN